MIWQRQVLRSLFFASAVFAPGLEDLRMAHHDFGEHPRSQWVALLALLAVSIALWRSDRIFACLGFITFVVVLASYLLMPRLAYN
jgi:hypothetical protein